MNTVYFTSDTHFQHEKVALDRGFASVEEHDECLVECWNQTVGPKDIVWHLGDVGIGRIERFAHVLRRLNGTIHLITGNHDKASPIHRDSHKHQRAWLDIFSSVQGFARRRISGYQVLLSHYPYTGDHTVEERYTQYRLKDEGLWLLHGHTHSSAAMSAPLRQINVGVDAWDFRPVSIDAVGKLVEGTEDDQGT